MKLGAKFAREILNGKRPALTDEPKLEVGQVVDLHRYAKFEIRPDEVKVTILKLEKANRWGYRLRDDRPRYLGRQTGITRKASHAIGSSDTRTGGNLWDEPEFIDGFDHDRLHREVGAAIAWDQQQQVLRGEKIRCERRLEDARLAGRRGAVRAIERQIERVDERLDDAA